MFDVQGRRNRYPQHQAYDGVAVERGRLRQTCCDELLGIVFIRGEEKVERRSILDLIEQVSGRTKRQVGCLSGLLLIIGGQLEERSIQVGSRSQRDPLAPGESTAQHRLQCQICEAVYDPHGETPWPQLSLGQPSFAVKL